MNEWTARMNFLFRNRFLYAFHRKRLGMMVVRYGENVTGRGGGLPTESAHVSAAEGAPFPPSDAGGEQQQVRGNNQSANAARCSTSTKRRETARFGGHKSSPSVRSFPPPPPPPPDGARLWQRTAPRRKAPRRKKPSLSLIFVRRATPTSPRDKALPVHPCLRVESRSYLPSKCTHWFPSFLSF